MPDAYYQMTIIRCLHTIRYLLLDFYYQILGYEWCLIRPLYINAKISRPLVGYCGRKYRVGLLNSVCKGLGIYPDFDFLQNIPAAKSHKLYLCQIRRPIFCLLEIYKFARFRPKFKNAKFNLSFKNKLKYSFLAGLSSYATHPEISLNAWLFLFCCFLSAW